MPDPASDQSDTTLSWPRDLVAAHLGIAPAANDPSQLLHVAAQFESFEDPVIVLVTVPFAIVGALPTLSVVPLVYCSIFSQTRATLPEPAAPHPRAASSGGLVAVLGE
jgi:hypothetical protein